MTISKNKPNAPKDFPDLDSDLTQEVIDVAKITNYYLVDAWPRTRFHQDDLKDYVIGLIMNYEVWRRRRPF